MKEQLESVGLESEGVIEHSRGRKRERSVVPERSSSMDVDNANNGSVVRSRSRSKSALAKKVRLQSATKGTREGSVAPHQTKQIEKSQRTIERNVTSYIQFTI